MINLILEHDLALEPIKIHVQWTITPWVGHFAMSPSGQGIICIMTLALVLKIDFMDDNDNVLPEI